MLGRLLLSLYSGCAGHISCRHITAWGPIFSALWGGQLAWGLEDSVTRGQPGHNISVMPFGSILNVRAILVGKEENSLKHFKVFCFMFLLFENLFSCSIIFSVPPLPPIPAQLIRISQRAGGVQSFTRASQKPPHKQQQKNSSTNPKAQMNHPTNFCWKKTVVTLAIDSYIPNFIRNFW